MENCSGHVLSDEVNEAQRKSNTEIDFSPPNATDLVQPADSFIIQKIKTEYHGKWDEKKSDMINKNMWVNPRTGSGKLVNAGKYFFLKPAKDAVIEVPK